MIALQLVASLVLASTPASSAPDWKAPLRIAECGKLPLELPAETELALAATLLVSTPKGTGSAVLVSPDGFALTAAHVVAGAEVVQIKTYNGEELSADVVRVNVEHDVALLHIERNSVSSCLPLQTERAALGSDVFVLGSPAGEELSFSVSKGIVSGHRTFEGAGFVQVDASVNAGNSGGPAVSGDGEVIGIASWKVSHAGVEGLAFAVPSNTIPRALGLEFRLETDPQWRDLMGVRGGASVSSASPGSTEVGRDRVEPFSTDRIRRKRAKRSLYTGGGVALALGLVPLIATAAVHRNQDRMPERRWKTIQGINTAGWAFAVAGAAAIVTGIAVPKRSGSERREQSAHVAWDGSTIRGRF